jgi:DNA mismatch endonuclease, patch repair protein
METVLRNTLPGRRFVGVSKRVSRQMRSIKGRGNRSTELVFLALLRQNKVKGWRRNWPLPGKPDFVFPRQRVAVFVDGCFWHGCSSCYRLPQTRKSYWATKRERNKLRDKTVTRQLKAKGWVVVRIWEHELRLPDRCLLRLSVYLKHITE